MKSLVFDAGPLISLTMNNLLWLLEPLKESFRGDFIIPESVKSELVDEPFQTKKFKFEALQVNELLTKGILTVYKDTLTKQATLQLLDVANTCFSAKGQNLKLVHYGEIASVATAAKLNAEALVMDERVTRELIEHPLHLARIMEKKLHTGIGVNKANVQQLKQLAGNVSIIRSTELAAIGFEKGLLDRYLSPGISRKQLLESVIWGLKIDGAAINERGIRAIMEAEAKRP